MAIAPSSDLTNILADWDSATYTPKGYPHPSNHTDTINGVFEESYISTDGVATKKPAFTTDSLNVPNPQNGDQLTFDSVVYTVRDIDFDGNGQVFLMLEKNP